MRPLCSTLAAVAHILALLSLSACLNEGSGSESGTEVDFKPLMPDNPVCDSIDDSSSLPVNGIVGELLYLDDSQPRYTSVEDYLAFGNSTDVSVIMSQFYIPTRPFDRGFVTESGETVLNGNGEDLYEYFALSLHTRLKLRDSDQAGSYQFAVLSDDGAIMRVGEAGELYIDNDGTHPTRLGCTLETIELDHESKLPISIDYYQGPRFHISLVLLWKFIPEGTTPTLDPLCGSQGNSLFFDSTNDPPTPQTAYNDLLSRGFQQLNPNNYLLPEEYEVNPCSDEAELVISNLDVNNISQTSANVVWTTNVAATSEITLKNEATGVETILPEDSLYKSVHSYVLSGLDQNTVYSIKATSRTEGGQEVTSPPFLFRTLR